MKLIPHGRSYTSGNFGGKLSMRGLLCQSWGRNLTADSDFSNDVNSTSNLQKLF